MRNFDSNIEERRRKIISLLRENEQMTVKEISEVFDISEVTVRRDLETLAAKNLIERTRGAARLNQDFIKDMPYFVDKRVKCLAEKKKLQRRPLQGLKAGMLFLSTPVPRCFFCPDISPSPTSKSLPITPAWQPLKAAKTSTLLLPAGSATLKLSLW